jgi:hypothetical protein
MVFGSAAQSEKYLAAVSVAQMVVSMVVSMAVLTVESMVH